MSENAHTITHAADHLMGPISLRTLLECAPPSVICASLSRNCDFESDSHLAFERLLGAALELLDLPDDLVLLGIVFSSLALHARIELAHHTAASQIDRL